MKWYVLFLSLLLLSLGWRNLHTLIGLLHFLSAAQRLSHSAETWAWINCHTLTDYLSRMLFCAGRMFEMPFTDTAPSPIFPSTLSFTIYPWAVVKQCNLVLQVFGRIILFLYDFSVRMQHTLYQCGVMRQQVNFSQGDFMERRDL